VRHGRRLPLPDRIELPDFSPQVKMLLQHGQADRGLGQALREAAIFYFFKYPGMKESVFYQTIGEKMIRAYPCLAMQGMAGAKPWVRIHCLCKYNYAYYLLILFWNIYIISFHCFTNSKYLELFKEPLMCMTYDL
jgi:hypothetical protein